ncbi:hypothetical protein M9Y10_039839 [Tritrichomonas musculus]|uniref:AIG1-type G domain-containing protein n=1 Tax=Tritrichomonas musculus TaxID=1915356 RepID=A0ABR2GS36_9EUKA
MINNAKEVTVVAFGETGVGKSENGNAFLQRNDAFRVSDSPGSCTSDVCLKSNIIDGIIVNYIDTQGFYSSNNLDDKYLFQVVNFLKNLKSGINAFFIILNIQNPRFDSGIQMMLRYINEIFNNPKYWNQVGIIFTRCYKDCFDRENAENYYKNSVVNFIQKLPGCENINLLIPCFFVDSKNWETDQSTQAEYQKALNFASTLQPVPTNGLISISTKYKSIENEYTYHNLYEVNEGKNEIIFQYEDLERSKIVTYDGEVLYSMPKVKKTYSRTKNITYNGPPPPPTTIHHYSSGGGGCLIM